VVITVIGVTTLPSAHLSGLTYINHTKVLRCLVTRGLVVIVFQLGEAQSYAFTTIDAHIAGETF